MAVLLHKYTQTVIVKTLLLGISLLGLSLIPIPHSFAVDAGPTFKTVSSGEHFTCGLTTLGDVYCWGQNERSQLGTSALNQSSTPNKVYRVSNAVEISSGRDFACARISDGGVACWGRGDLGQTGDGIETKIDRIFATRVQSVNTAIGISVGEAHACVLLKNQSVHCWGVNSFYQLGNTSSLVETMPVQVLDLPLIKKISSGRNHTCALAETEFVYCWGDNKFGQLGIGTTQILKATPSPALGVKKVSDIQIGYDSSCASQGNSGFSCWGQGSDGQLAETDRFSRSIPVPITLASITDSATALVSISLGRTKSCGLLSTAKSNAMYCWGTVVSTDPISGSSGVSVSLGSDHACLVTTTGTVNCWGWNHKGQLGRDTITNSVSTIGIVSGFPDWTYWINTWSIKYEDNLGVLTWTGGTGKYLVSIDEIGIVCEVQSGIKSCKFGPLKPNQSYSGTISAQNTPVANSRFARIEFTTGDLVSALSAYNQVLEAEKKAKIEFEKALVFISTLAEQVAKSNAVIDNFLKQESKIIDIENAKIDYILSLEDALEARRLELRKMQTTINNIILKIIKKINE